MRFFTLVGLLCFIGFTFKAAAQEDQGVGYIMILNLVATGQPSFITLGDLELYNGEAMKPGDSSSYLGMYAGEYAYSIRNEGAEEPELLGTIVIKPEETIALVFYNNAKQNKDGTVEHEIVATPVNKKAKDESARLSLVLLAQQPLAQVRVKGAFYDLPRLKAIEIPVSPNEEISVKFQEDPIGDLTTLAGQHVFGFVYDSPAGEVPALTLRSIELTQIDYVAPEVFEEDAPKEAPAAEPEEAATEPAE